MIRLPLALIVTLAILTACTSAPTRPPRSPLERAEGLFAAGDFGKARAAVEEQLADEPDDARTRYLLARCLANLGELQGARAQAEQSLELDGENTLAWDLLAGVCEQLGAHRDALSAYHEVHKRLFSDSKAPALAIARCQLYLGQPEAALVTLESLSSKKPDAWAEFFRYQALKRMGRSGEAEDAARGYLDMASEREEHDDYVPRVRRWLEAQRTGLEPALRQTLVDYVRAACEFQLPNGAPPQEAVLARAPDRMFVFDDRPVFVTLFSMESGEHFRGRGRGRSLAEAVKGAVDTLQQSEGYAPLKVRDAALRIDLGRDLEHVELRHDGQRFVSSPAIELGRHGLALRADGTEIFCLPGDPITEDLDGRLESMLAFAARSAGLSERAWQAATNAVFRFETESFVSPRPGAAPTVLTVSEPGPSPEPTVRSLLKASRRAGAWLAGLIQPKGGLSTGYSAPFDTLDASSDQGLAIADPAIRARVALAFARIAFAAPNNRTALAARDHLLSGLDLDTAGAASRASALRALDRNADGLAELQAKLMATFAAPPRRDRKAAALALITRDPKRAKALAGRAALLTLENLADVELLLALAKISKRARARAVEWGVRQLTTAPPADGIDRARWLAAVAGAARYARMAKNPQATQLRTAVVEQARALLRLQMGERHRFLCKAPSRALGAVRDHLATSHLRPETTAEAVLAFLAVRETLRR